MKTNLLTKEEHEYLSAVIKPFRDRIGHYLTKNITVCIDAYITKLYIALGSMPLVKIDCAILNNSKITFNNLENLKHYTLEELGL